MRVLYTGYPERENNNGEVIGRSRHQNNENIGAINME